MFDEIWDLKGETIDPAAREAVGKEYQKKLVREFATGTCVAWVVEVQGAVVASGAVSILPYVPVPHDPGSRIAVLHSIYTEKGYRRRQYARRITDAAAEYCRKQGIRRMYLFASSAGQQVYEKAGFAMVPNMMMRLL
jgi:GNAT superfamily N-acetyltransferase